jgi:hypothetical protein
MNLLNFAVSYHDETSCKLKFKQIREKAGISCKKCGSRAHYWLSSKQMWQCKTCRFRTSLRSGTIMESSKLPFRYWFVAMYLMGSCKKSCSAYHVQRQLGHKRYEPIWSMLHKIRSAMGKRDNGYLLTESVEIDEGFFETIPQEADKHEVRKRGRGSQKQTMAMVFAESKTVQKSKKHRPGKQCRYFKMVVCPRFDADTARTTIQTHIAENTAMLTDGYSTYQQLAKEFTHMKTEKIPKKMAHILLPWVHTAIGNAKKVLQGIHQHTTAGYLQNYLDEFCYKLNRRYFGNRIFERILLAATLA